MSHGEAQKPNLSRGGRIQTPCVTLVNIVSRVLSCQVLGMNVSVENSWVIIAVVRYRSIPLNSKQKYQVKILQIRRILN